RQTLAAIGLEQHAPRFVSPTGAARHPGEELEGSLARAEVGQGQAGIGTQHADEADAGAVEPFGDHLGTDQHVDLLAGHSAEYFLNGLAARDIAIETLDPRARKALGDGFGDLFGSKAAPLDRVLAAALGAGMGKHLLVR